MILKLPGPTTDLSVIISVGFNDAIASPFNRVRLGLLPASVLRLFGI